MGSTYEPASKLKKITEVSYGGNTSSLHYQVSQVSSRQISHNKSPSVTSLNNNEASDSQFTRPIPTQFSSSVSNAPAQSLLKDSDKSCEIVIDQFVPTKVEAVPMEEL